VTAPLEPFRADRLGRGMSPSLVVRARICWHFLAYWSFILVRPFVPILPGIHGCSPSRLIHLRLASKSSGGRQGWRATVRHGLVPRALISWYGRLARSWGLIRQLIEISSKLGKFCAGWVVPVGRPRRPRRFGDVGQPLHEILEPKASTKPPEAKRSINLAPYLKPVGGFTGLGLLAGGFGQVGMAKILFPWFWPGLSFSVGFGPASVAATKAISIHVVAQRSETYLHWRERPHSVSISHRRFSGELPIFQTLLIGSRN